MNLEEIAPFLAGGGFLITLDKSYHIIYNHNMVCPKCGSKAVNDATAAITTPTYDSSVASLSDLLPLLMIVVIILAVFKGFGEI